MSLTGTLALVLIGQDLAIVGVDSRTTGIRYGSVHTDDAIKFMELSEGILLLAAGEIEFRDAVFKKVINEDYASVMECAGLVALIATEHATELSENKIWGDYILFGIKHKRIDIFRVKQVDEEEIGSASVASKRKYEDLNDYRFIVEEVNADVCLGTGKDHLLACLQADDRYPLMPDSTIDVAKDLVKSAMGVARRKDYKTDGAVRAVTLCKLTGEMKFWGAKPSEARPSAPYLPWEENQFQPLKSIEAFFSEPYNGIT